MGVRERVGCGSARVAAALMLTFRMNRLQTPFLRPLLVRGLTALPQSRIPKDPFYFAQGIGVLSARLARVSGCSDSAPLARGPGRPPPGSERAFRDPSRVATHHDDFRVIACA